MEYPRIINLPKIPDPRGSLSFIESSNHIPFEINRVFYIYDVPGGASRGAHAHRVLYQFIIAVSGSFEVFVTDGIKESTYLLKRPYEGLLIPPGIWCEIRDFSSGACCLVLASHPYEEEDYIREYDDYLIYKSEKHD
ncbi:MAG: sugar 3,4-ketoisomerase [Bacteroidales bacterium]